MVLGNGALELVGDFPRGPLAVAERASIHAPGGGAVETGGNAGGRRETARPPPLGSLPGVLHGPQGLAVDPSFDGSVIATRLLMSWGDVERGRIQALSSSGANDEDDDGQH